MVLTTSSMLALGTKAPDFTLKDTVSGENFALAQSPPAKATVIMFICNHCPYVVHIIQRLVQITEDFQKQSVNFIAISANDVESYPDDHPDRMQEFAAKYAFDFPYLYDESQETAKAYHAECTPDFFIFDKTLSCVYRGRFDNSSPGKKEVKVTGEDLCTALEQLLSGRPISSEQKPSIGCNIKWKG